MGGLCAAATAAVAELLPVVSGAAVYGQASTIVLFPAFSALFAAAASVSKARCEVDAKAASLAASSFTLQYNDENGKTKSRVLKPFTGVKDLIQLTVRSTIQKVRNGKNKSRWRFWRWWRGDKTSVEVKGAR